MSNVYGEGLRSPEVSQLTDELLVQGYIYELRQRAEEGQGWIGDHERDLGKEAMGRYLAKRDVPEEVGSAHMARPLDPENPIPLEERLELDVDGKPIPVDAYVSSGLASVHGRALKMILTIVQLPADHSVAMATRELDRARIAQFLPPDNPNEHPNVRAFRESASR